MIGDRTPGRPEVQVFEREAPEISLVAPVNLALAHWRPLIIIPMVLGILGASYGLLRPRYLAQSGFVSETAGRGNAGQLLGLASQFGINLGSGGENFSADYYNWLLQSRELLQEVVRTKYSVPISDHDTLSGTLVELYKVSGQTPVQRERKAIRKLQGDFSVSIDRASTVITLRTNARYPALAEAINRRFLQLVNQFNIERRRTTATAQRDFARERVDSAQREVILAENALRDFLQRNRRIQTAPELMLEQARLQRVLALRQQVLTTLTQSYEQSRVDAVRDTPVLSIVERPEGSARSNTGVFRRGVIGAVVGFMLTLLVILVREYARRQRAIMPAEYDEFDRLWRQTMGRISPGRRLAAGERGKLS